MTHSNNRPLTPIYLKTQAEMTWPEDTFYYLMTADGLFVCRNHKFFRSCVKARKWPSELARQEPFLRVAYPKLSQRAIERIVGFFSRVADLHGSEAGVLLAWDQAEEQIQVVVPDQLAAVTKNRWGDIFPSDVKYEVPADLPAHWVLIGDVHSHVDYLPTPSFIDDVDETHRPGLHVIVGRIYSEPPEFHVEAVVDGRRFVVRPELVMEDYRQRRTDVPDAWIDKVRVEVSGYGADKRDDCGGADGDGKKKKKGGRRKSPSYCSEPDEPDDPEPNMAADLEPEADAAEVSLSQLPEPDQYPDTDPIRPHKGPPR